MILLSTIFFFFFFNDTATTEIYTLSLHDALPISCGETTCKMRLRMAPERHLQYPAVFEFERRWLRLKSRLRSFCSLGDRKSTRLNSSHSQISYAVFCLKKKKKH